MVRWPTVPTVKQSGYPRVLVDLDVLIAPADEDRVAEAIRSSVSAAAREPTYRLGESTWGEALDGDDLVRQWRVEHAGKPLGDRRVRRFTLGVEGDGVADLLDDLSWAAIEAVCPNAREDERRIALGETVSVTADEFPWSSATRVVTGPEDEPTSGVNPNFRSSGDDTGLMASEPSSALSFEAFVRQVTRVRETALTPAGRLLARETGVEPERLLARLSTVERIGAAMTATDLADPASLTVADKQRVARGSDVSPAEVDDVITRYRSAIGDAGSG